MKTTTDPPRPPRRTWERLLLAEHMVLALCVAAVLLFWTFEPEFVSAANAGNIASNMLPLLVLAIGQTFVLVTGGIDLSITATMALASVLGATIMTTDGGHLAGSPL